MAEAVPVFTTESPRIRKIELDRPWHWLAAGWRDLWRAPLVSLGCGVIFAAVGYAITLGLWLADMIYLVLPMVCGFIIVGPLMAVGLYEISRRLEAGEPVSLTVALLAWRRNASQIGLMGVALMLFLFAWIRLAALLFMLFYGLAPPSLETLVADTFLSPEGLPFLIIGTLIGGVLSALVYAISVVSVPLLLDRPDANVITAIATSVVAVRENLVPLAFWAVLIVGFAAAGLVTLYLGLIVTLPLIGHATWHAYRDLVDHQA
ncbi:MAG: DUF2189 domain-containing protein [Geminicoccaceae bacterium]